MSSTTILEGSSINKTVDESNVEDPTVLFSEFGEAECGEPESEQHIVLDFTPDPEIDNEIVQKKICDFWKMINNSPEIQNLKVTPTKCEQPTKPSRISMQPSRISMQPSRSSSVAKQQPEEKCVDMTKTACSMLKIIEEKNLITRAFESRMPQAMCTLGPYEEKKEKKEKAIQQKKKGHYFCPLGSYEEEQYMQRTHKTPRVPKVCSCAKPCQHCPGKNLSPLKQLCLTLEQWDDKHPQSMDPPGHAPPLTHCVIQRQVHEF